MERFGVASSNLKSVGYDPDEKILEVEFNSGAIYQYEGVPQSTYQDLLDADSVGAYFNQNVKFAGYSYKRI